MNKGCQQRRTESSYKADPFPKHNNVRYDLKLDKDYRLNACTKAS